MTKLAFRPRPRPAKRPPRPPAPRYPRGPRWLPPTTHVMPPEHACDCGRLHAREGRWVRDGGNVLVLDLEPEDRETSPLEALEQEVGARPVLRRGSRGAAVQELQTRLARAGFSPGAIDGIFGSGTDAAVRAFQAARGLTVDGIAGSQTWSSLLGGAAPVPSPPQSPSAGAHSWVLPADVRAAGEAQQVRYDSPPPWAGDPGNCSNTFTPGAADLKNYIQATFPGVSSIGGYACRQNTAKTSETSVHGVGRALDIMIPRIGGRANAAIGDPIANWLVKSAAAIGIQYVIWNRTRWSGSASGRKDAPYGGPHPHDDHIHAELNLAGATRATAWFRARARTG